MSTFGKIGASTLLNHKKYARDYIQNGLIALWDAEENVGWNQHSSNPSVWKNLVGNGLDMISNGNPVFYDQYIAPTAVNQLWHTDLTNLFDECINSSTFTFEVATQTEPEDVVNNRPTGVLLFGGDNGGWSQMINVYTYIVGSDNRRVGATCNVRVTNPGKAVGPYIYRTYTAAQLAAASLQQTCSVVSRGENGSVGVHSVSKTSDIHGYGSFTAPNTLLYSQKRFCLGYRYTNSGDSPLVNGTKVYCIRVYNRALSLDELKVNATIDQERFRFT